MTPTLRRGPGRVALVVATLVLSLLAAGAALACTCIARTDAEHLQAADVVFAGTVVAREDPNAGAPIWGSGDPIVSTLQVTAVAKGSAAPLRRVVNARNGASCGIEFVVGRRYLVYANATSDPWAALSTSLCAGTRELRPGQPFPAFESAPPLPPDFDVRGSDFDRDSVRRFRAFPLFWLGEYFWRFSLRSIVRRGTGARGSVTFTYAGGCVRLPRGGCAPPVRVRVSPECPPPGPGRRVVRRLRVGGAVARLLPGKVWELRRRGVTVRVSPGGMARRALESLQPVTPARS